MTDGFRFSVGPGPGEIAPKKASNLIEITCGLLAIGSDDPPTLRHRFAFIASIDPDELHRVGGEEFWRRFALIARSALESIVSPQKGGFGHG